MGLPMDSRDLREEKKQVLLEALDAAPTVMLHLDARREGVKVPDVHRSNYALALRVGYMLSPPINLSCGDEFVTCTLSFNRTPFYCELPWDAIYAIACDDGRAAVWPDDIPPEAAARFSGAFAGRSDAAAGAERVEAPGAEAKAKRTPPRKDKPRLGSVDAGVRARPVTVRGGASEAKSPPEAPPPAGSDAPQAEGDSAPPAAERKPKRELPPYLRVVK